MIFREAFSADIPAIQYVRNSVKENRLSDPGLVSDGDVEDYIKRRGKGWVCEINDQVIGFAIADLQKKNIWALFILPQYEGKGIGKKLHDDMMNWYFDQGIASVWFYVARYKSRNVLQKIRMERSWFIRQRRNKI
ncbi:MAG: N-acetyltransferase family protein [Chitinophagaceae bacterium]